MVLCNDLDMWDKGGGRELKEGGGVCIHIADAICCAAETLKQLYSSRKVFMIVFVFRLKIQTVRKPSLQSLQEMLNPLDSSACSVTNSP